MNRITFMASGYTNDRCSEKELWDWRHRCERYGYPCQLQMDSHGSYLVIDDTADPFFKPKENPPHVADGKS